ncbi:TPA: major outer membrane protein [Campylobacter jejuni]|nr:major outer membrane protein [Campylobacter jejuni]HEG5223679.1 major outer membrane protein [Campylobacter jejuni]HEG5337600.1 major outer membrane protein [Campylobacter jejuni]
MLPNLYEYNNPDYQTSVKAGKQQMDSIWTENYYDGLVATGLKITNTSLDGIMFQAYAYDSYNSDKQGGVGGDMGVYKDYSNPNSSYTQLPIYEKIYTVLPYSEITKFYKVI